MDRRELIVQIRARVVEPPPPPVDPKDIESLERARFDRGLFCGLGRWHRSDQGHRLVMIADRRFFAD
jgi:hypothetical protein